MDISIKTLSEIKSILCKLPEIDLVCILSLMDQDTRVGVRKLAASHRLAIKKDRAEKKKTAALLQYECRLKDRGFERVAGVDEAGRGALAGPLVAAAAVLPEYTNIRGLRDSKQLTPAKRDELYDIIIDTAVAWNIVRVENSAIDARGIQWANLYGLEQAVLGLAPAADYILSDAFELPTVDIPSLAIVKGDAKSLSIAAASVLAKVTRDRIMLDYHQQYPQYRFDQHKGYGTALHIELIDKHGASPLHRLCFAPCAAYKQLTLET